MTRVTRLFVWLCSAGAAMLLLSGCGHRFTNKQSPAPAPTRAATPPPTASPTASRGGIASGAASGVQGAAPGAAPAASAPSPGSFGPPNAGGSCPPAHPIKIGRDTHAYAPGSAGYDSVKPIACYATLADARANGYMPATPTPTPAPSP